MKLTDFASDIKDTLYFQKYILSHLLNINVEHLIHLCQMPGGVGIVTPPCLIYVKNI